MIVDGRNGQLLVCDLGSLQFLRNIQRRLFHGVGGVSSQRINVAECPIFR